jgi:formylglycine-generating enzyme required for sulfatase activity/flavodoxin
MIATVLHRAEGSPAADGTNPFSDVENGTWYTNAVIWAADNGLVSGYRNGVFGTNDPITREQAAAILWRYAGSPATNENSAAFTDLAQISSWATNAVNWAVSNGVINIKTGNVLDPKGNAIRAELAFMLMQSLSGAKNDFAATEGFALVEGGAFTMGSPDSEYEREADEIQHEVIVSDFYIAQSEVTQAQYNAVMGNNPSANQNGGNLPVENVTWYDAVRYCNALSQKDGLTPAYIIEGQNVSWDRSANGYRLPTEAEWEFACRAGTATPFSFGDYVEDSDANCYNAYGYNNNASGNWVNGYLQHTVAVDSYSPNNFGLYNMHGNVSEWVWDWYGAYGVNPVSNPMGSAEGNYKAARGGGWNDMPKNIRSAYRIAFPADVPLYSIGIRLAQNAESAQGIALSAKRVQSESRNGKVLIAYFSQTGNTEGFAEIIKEQTNADIFRIERETPYSSTQNSQSLYAEALTELRESATPNLANYLEDVGLDINQYDTILLGYSNWWASIPASVRTFLTHYDLSGKTIIPFCSQGGGRFGQTISAVTKLAPNSTVKEGLYVTYSSYDREHISAWLKQSGIIE